MDTTAGAAADPGQVTGDTRRATCSCGELAIECEGEPVRVSVCHCLDCQRRSGSAFAAQARFPRDRVRVTGEARTWTRVGDGGAAMTFSFCPTCGTRLFYAPPGDDWVAVGVGGFADPAFPPPAFSVWEQRRHPWVAVTGDFVEHWDD